MEKHYTPQPRKPMPGEHEARLLDYAPDRSLSRSEIKRLRIMHEEIAEAIGYARDGNVPSANSTYASVSRKAQGMDHTENLYKHLGILKGAIDEAMEEREKKARLSRIEVTTIPSDVSENYPQAEEPARGARPQVEGEEHERSEKPHYYSWEEAYELMDCKWDPTLNKIIGKKWANRNLTTF